MDGDEAYPLEIGGSETSAMGFITPEAAEILDYDYEDSGLNDFVSVILGNVNNEPEDGTYEFRLSGRAAGRSTICTQHTNHLRNR